MEFLKKEYIAEKRAFNEQYRKIFFILIGLIFAIWLGVHFALISYYKSNPDAPMSIMSYIQEALSGIGDFETTPTHIIMVRLFFNNARVCLMVILFGAIPFLFLPYWIYFSNMAMLGMVSSIFVGILQQSMIYYASGILPHGIFELPAIIYATCLGAVVCLNFTKAIIGKARKSFDTIIVDAVRGYCLVVIPLLMVAAFIEAYITPVVMFLFE